MRILLTGTSGQVGGALRSVLTERHEVLAPGRAQFDLSRAETLADALDALKPDLILNPAAYTAVDRAEEEVDLAHRVNANAPISIARWAERRHVPLIHFSTDYVFDGSGDRPWREDDETAPLSVYGVSKLAGEKGVREAGGPHLIIRTSWVYASRGSNFLLTIARLARERPELRIVSDQIGAPTSARAIATAVKSIMECDSPELTERLVKSGGLVHMTASGHTNWHAFATTIVSGLRSRGVPLAVKNISPISSEEFPTKAVRPRNSRLDNSRLKSVFDVEMPTWDLALLAELDHLSSAITSTG